MNIRFERNKTSTVIVMDSLYLYFLGLNLHNTSKALIIFKDQKRSHVSDMELDSEIWFISISTNVKEYLLL